MRHMVLAICLLGVACRVAPVRLGGDSATGQSLNNRTEFTEKVVNMKRQPWTFIARDGSRCTVAEEVWRATEVGERATCMWEFTGQR